MNAKEIGEHMKKAVENNIKAVVIDIHSSLAQDTPKDTGWAASNWIPSVSVPELVNCSSTSMKSEISDVF